ncbi:type IV toxin-antitoxin system AbiEi family antitoxin [Mycobacterium sp. 1423905.2]|uniref:type IV toxin-antitoxin system AbiEi family antitoxin n=1 Tax=Mycobacterium sp. 1423905.2 TaxID=1856859 RepID=UPI000802157B|nr:type IV toxin-antitoxin system AbiEi family antitoxin [Mycobacterium sp. 1423905.2]OBJ58196.1 hypothetical protein A9W95_12030 [Mycobacterium sp. 1423905.2]
MTRPFLGSEAVRGGTLRPHHLRTRFHRIFPDVYVARDQPVLSLRQRTEAAWLWSHRQGVVAGVSAAACHGSKWVDERLPIELIWPNARPPQGIRTYDVCLDADEVGVIAHLPVTTPARTAYDLARRPPLDAAIARLDALISATGVKVEEVAELAERHPGARGLRQLDSALQLVDTGSQSPRETWLRLLLLRAGFPRPVTQIPVVCADGRQVFYLDMAWEDLLVAVEYDGEHHRLDRWQYTKDIRRSEALERLGWLIIRVVATDRPADIVRRVRDARELRASSLR